MLELVDLRKRFADITALDGCSFRVPAGRILGFVGRNGAGKTTTMRSIFGLVRLDAGRVLWDGHLVTPEDRLEFGYMPEERGLYPRMRISEQLRYFARLHGMDSNAAAREAARWLDRLDLGDRADAALDTLSHGNQQRIQLAVSLVGRPRLLVLDEPFSGLDPIASGTLAEVIREAAEGGAAVVFSSHQLDLVEGVCDDIAVITRGRVVLSGVLEEIQRDAPQRYIEFKLERDIARSEFDALTRQWEGVLVGSPDGAVRIQVPATTDPAAVAAALGRVGPVQYFRFEPPGLVDIFREVVGE